MFNHKIYYNYQYISLNKLKPITLIIFFIVLSLGGNLYFFKPLSSNKNFSQLIIGTFCILIFLLFLLNCHYILKFTYSKEYIFLKSFGISKLDNIIIIIIKFFWLNLTISIIYFNTMINLNKISVNNIFYLLTNSILIFLLFLLLEILVCFIIKKIYIREIKIFLYIILSLYIVNFIIILPFKLYGINNILNNIIIYIGSSKFANLLFSKFLNLNFISLVILISSISLIFIIIYFFIDFNNFNNNTTIIKYKFFNKKIKRYPLLAGFLIKDIILIKRNIWFLIMQIIFLFIGIFLLIYILSKNSLEIFILCFSFLYLSSFISQEIFKFEEKYIWLIKMLPIENKKFFIYKVISNFSIIIIVPISLLLIGFIFNKLNIYYLLKFIIFIILLGILLSLSFSSVIYAFFPNSENSTIPLILIGIFSIVFPPVIIISLILSLKFIKNKINNIEV